MRGAWTFEKGTCSSSGTQREREGQGESKKPCKNARERKRPKKIDIMLL